MPRCAATTRSGHRCLNRAIQNSDFCARHGDQISGSDALASIVGAVVGNAVLPGLGGVIVGGLAGPVVRRALKGGQVAKKRVFVSFDFDNDRALKEFVIGQSRLAESPFEVIDHSLKEAAPQRDWKEKARERIRRADIVLVIAGQYTYRAPGVLAEVAMAREARIPLVQMIGYGDKNCPTVPDAGRVYAWSWENLKNVLS